MIRQGNHILGMGYNGAPAGIAQCNEVGCLISDSGHCLRSVHAEINAILNCKTKATRFPPPELWTTHQPCVDCTKAIITFGIPIIVYLNHKDYPDLTDLYASYREHPPVSILHWDGAKYHKIL